MIQQPEGKEDKITELCPLSMKDTSVIDLFIWWVNVPFNNYSVILGQNHCFLGINLFYEE